MSQLLDFGTTEERDAFLLLLQEIPKRQSWDDIKTFQKTKSIDCHICDSQEGVKRGRTPVDCFFENTSVDAYVYWQLCNKCHSEGWSVALWSFRNSLEYRRFHNHRHRLETKRVLNLKRFLYPSICLVDLTSLLI